MSNQFRKALEDKAIHYDSFVTESDSVSMRRRYEEQIQGIYEDAKRRHVKIFSNCIVEYPTTDNPLMGMGGYNLPGLSRRDKIFP